MRWPRSGRGEAVHSDGGEVMSVVVGGGKQGCC